MEIKTLSMPLAGRTLTLETGRMAFQAHGAVSVRFGDTMVLCTAMMADEGRPDADFFPLTVEFQEKYYAAGKIKGSRFIKREGRPSDEATLKSRLIDRPIRPQFPKGITNEVQLVNMVLSSDLVNEPGVLAITGSSAAIMAGGMPFEKPLSAVRIGMENGELVVMPTEEQMKNGQLDLIVAGTEDAIAMVEAGASEVDEETMIRALQLAQDTIKELCLFQKKFLEMLSPETRSYTTNKSSDEILSKVMGSISSADLDGVSGLHKIDVKKKVHALEEKVLAHFASEIEADTVSEGALLDALSKLIDEQVRANILNKGVRVDGRALDEIRPLSIELDLLPRTHGSALFQRGETQALTTTTLGGPGDAMIIDTMDMDVTKRYIHYYNFPPFSVGEVKGIRGTSRREIGHGFLAERALEPVLPSKEDFPYTMLLVSEIMTCNGSSSMASVCGSTLSLMAAGVPIKRPVAGIAMGLVTSDEFRDSGKGEYKILTDIQGFEDFAGDMDFKVAGSEQGITALQMDIKVKGITIEMMKEAMMKAKTAREVILAKIKEVLPAPRPQLSAHAPMILTIQINPDKIRDVIGKGGETIQKISAECNVQIDIEQDGLVMITAPDQISGQKAEKWIKTITYDPQVGEEFEGTVVRLMDFGAFVEFLPGKDGLVHISNLRPFRVNRVEDVVKLGDTVKVRLREVDDQGRYNLSMKEYYEGPMPGAKPEEGPQA